MNHGGHLLWDKLGFVGGEESAKGKPFKNF